MSLKRKKINILLIILNLILGAWAVWLFRRPALVSDPLPDTSTEMTAARETIFIHEQVPAPAQAADTAPVQVTSAKEMPVADIKVSGFKDIEPRVMTSDNPFRKEAAKLLSGRLEETDSASRHKILSYCEHLRTSYTTRDIDFIRQVFSDNALIIVGHVVKASDSHAAMASSDKVRYSVRSKHEYLERLSKVFDSGKEIAVDFSDFRIMRHPTMEGIYGVTLRQHYSAGSYSDDGYLFLLWDFRNMSMPLIHVRTWQPSMSVDPDADDIIGIGDFNLE